MRALIQRVSSASVSVNDARIGAIDAGFLILVCAMQDDTDADASKLAAKISKLRVFKDEAGKMNRSLVDTGGAALVVSQFTLAGDTSRGNRPGFSSAARPDEGDRLFERFKADMAALGVHVESGQFGADMQVSLINNGPVTLWLDTRA